MTLLSKRPTTTNGGTKIFCRNRKMRLVAGSWWRLLLGGEHPILCRWAVGHVVGVGSFEDFWGGCGKSWVGENPEPESRGACLKGQIISDRPRFVNPLYTKPPVFFLLLSVRGKVIQHCSWMKTPICLTKLPSETPSF